MASQGYLDNLPEVVQDSRLEAVFGLDGQRAYTVHPEYTNPRAPSNQERWFHRRTLGSGGGGRVDLEVKESRSSNGPPQLRAVKKVEMTRNEKMLKLHQRELVAIFKFSQPKYSTLFVKSYGWFTSERYIHISMEYLELGDLQHYLSDRTKCPENRLPESEVHSISEQILYALNAMHSVGFSHRDLKPANVLIKSHPPQDWKVKLADFGISKRGGEVTESTDVRGTKNFMPPEMLGEVSDKPEMTYSFAIDMWCFGQTIHRLMTGQNPFNSILAIAKYWEGSIEFPTAALESVNASVGLLNFVRSLMVADPKNRSTAVDGLNDPWMAMDSPLPSSGSNSDMPSDQPTPQPPSSAAPISQDQYTDSEATSSWTDVLPTRTSYYYETEKRMVSQVTDGEATATWSEALSYPDASSSNITEIKESTTTDNTFHETPFGISYADLDQAIWNKSLNCSVSERVSCSAARQQHRDVHARLKDLGPEHPFTISSMQSLGLSLVDLKLNEPAAAVLRETLALEEKVLGVQTIQTLMSLAMTLQILKKSDESEVLFRKIIAINKKNNWTHTPAGIGALQAFGLLLYETGKFEESAAMYKESAALLRGRKGQENNLLETLENLIRAYNMSQKLEKANETSRGYITLHKILRNKPDEKFIAVTYLLGSNLEQLKKPHEAEIVFREARRLVRVLPSGESHELLPQIVFGLGKVFYSQGKYLDSELAIKEALYLLPKPVGPEDLHLCLSKIWLALALEKQAKYEEAALIRQELSRETEGLLGPNAEETLTAKLGLGRTLVKADRIDEAEKILTEVTHKRFKLLGKHDPKTIESVGLLAQCQKLKGGA